MVCYLKTFQSILWWGKGGVMERINGITIHFNEKRNKNIR